MAQVTLRINGYAYTLGCQDGEETHLQTMAEAVEARIEGIKSSGGQSGESRMLVMAALMMADDLFEMDMKLKAAEARADDTPSAARTAPDFVPKPEPKPDPKLGRKLGKLALRAEEIAAGLDPN